jgi:hypothetical protein
MPGEWLERGGRVPGAAASPLCRGALLSKCQVPAARLCMRRLICARGGRAGVDAVIDFSSPAGTTICAKVRAGSSPPPSAPSCLQLLAPLPASCPSSSSSSSPFAGALSLPLYACRPAARSCLSLTVSPKVARG